MVRCVLLCLRDLIVKILSPRQNNHIVSDFSHTTHYVILPRLRATAQIHTCWLILFNYSNCLYSHSCLTNSCNASIGREMESDHSHKSVWSGLATSVVKLVSSVRFKQGCPILVTLVEARTLCSMGALWVKIQGNLILDLQIFTISIYDRFSIAPIRNRWWYRIYQSDALLFLMVYVLWGSEYGKVEVPLGDTLSRMWKAIPNLAITTRETYALASPLMCSLLTVSSLEFHSFAQLYRWLSISCWVVGQWVHSGWRSRGISK